MTPNKVLVVFNGSSVGSADLAYAYIAARGIPVNNLVEIDWNTDEAADTMTMAQYNTMEKIVYDRAQKLGTDAILICRNLPYKITGVPGSVDSRLATRGKGSRMNPYRSKTGSFNSTMYGMYLVTRLDGYTWDDAHKLIFNSMATIDKPAPWAVDLDPGRCSGGYLSWTNRQKSVANYIEVISDNTKNMLVPTIEVGGYCSWGSNASTFNRDKFKSIKFQPHAIAETAVSTSGRTFRNPTVSGQSLVADLIAAGVTGVKGYVSEPMLSAIADPSQMARCYSQGMNLAETFYSSSMYIGWQDVVIGDPLATML